MSLARLALVVGGLLAGCSELPAKQLRADCTPRCLDEGVVRSRSADRLVQSPGLWRFYDDHLETLVSECADAGGGGGDLAPLFRRGVPPFFGGIPRGNARDGDRSGLAVHPDGLVALQAGRSLLLLEADSGTPLHLYLGAEGAAFDDAPQIVAFAGSSTKLWFNGSGPMLVDLEDWDRIHGPRVLFSWFRSSPQTSFAGWAYSAPSVADDGTLVFTTFENRTRALALDGSIRWDVPSVPGPQTLDPNGIVYALGTTPIGRRVTDGGVVWVPAGLPTWNAVNIPIDEGTPVPALVPVTWRDSATMGVDGVLGLHDATGALVASLREGDGGLLHAPERVATARDGAFFVSGRAYVPAEGDTATFLSGYSSSRQRLWTVRTPRQLFAPIPGERSNRLFTVTGDCRVNVMDENGTVIASHQMVGKAGGFVPKLVNGVLYVLAETTTPAEVQAGAIRTRPDGGTVDVAADYQCFGACPPIEAGPFYVLYAFRVE